MNIKGFPIVISAPSGAGKTTLANLLIHNNKNLMLSTSYTTRDLRGQELNKIDYNFVTIKQFRKMILDNFFLEWSFVHNHHYGSSSLLTERVLCNGINLIFDIDVNGGLQIKQQYPNAVLVFILPISNFELKKRLIKRGTESEKFITERVKIASREIDIGLKKYDYIIENIDVDKAFIDLSNIIYNHTLY